MLQLSTHSAESWSRTVIRWLGLEFTTTPAGVGTHTASLRPPPAFVEEDALRWHCIMRGKN